MLDHNGPGHFGSSSALGFSEPNFVKKIEGNHFRTNPEQAMASSATSATSFELIEDQALTAEEVEMASQEAQEVRTREAAVAAGLEAEGLRGGLPADHGPGEQTGLPGAGGWPSWLFQASGPPRPLPGPSGIGGHVGRRRSPCSTSLSVRISRRTWWFASWRPMFR